MKLILIGGGALAQQIKHYIDLYDTKVGIVGFVDDTCEIGAIKFGMPCLGGLEHVYELFSDDVFDLAILAIGYKHLQFKKLLYDKMSVAFPFYTFIHPSAYVDVSASIGKGCVIGPRVIIDQRATIEDNVFLYNGVNISHDSIIGSTCFIAPSVSIAGFVRINSCCFIGINTTVSNSLDIVSNVVVGASSLILDNITEAGTYIGSPARKK